MFALLIISCLFFGCLLGLFSSGNAPNQPEQVTTEHDENSEQEKQYLQCRLAMLEDLQRMIEEEYQTATGKRRITLQRQLLSTDEQIHRTQLKIAKLEE